jgi:ligand-binding sensor domain-containing protein
LKRLITLSLTLLTSIYVFAQIAPGKWRDHFSYNNCISVTSGNGKIYAASENGIFSFNPLTQEIEKINKVNRLSSIGIKTIAYSPFENLLLVGYKDGNIDMVYSNRVVNIPFIKDKPMSGMKDINHFNFISNEKVLVSTGFGIVELNPTRSEISDTYYIGENGAERWVNQTHIHDGSIYAATAYGLFYANATASNLFHFAAWTQDQSLPSYNNNIKSITTFKGQLIINQSMGSINADRLWAYNISLWEQVSHPLFKINDIVSTNQNLYLSSIEGVLSFSNLSYTHIQVYPSSGVSNNGPNFIHITQQGEIAIGHTHKGLVYKNTNDWIEIIPIGPINNHAFHVATNGTDVHVAAGGRTDVWGNFGLPYTIHSFSQNSWTTIEDYTKLDAVRVWYNPYKPNEHYISTWGWGLARYENNEPKEIFNPENSTLQNIIPGTYCRISGIAFDPAGNLWVSNATVERPISVKTPNGSWYSFPYQSQISASRLSDLTISPSGHLWLVLAAGNGVFVLDPGTDPTSMGDDSYRKPTFMDPQGNALSNDVYCLSFDRDGYLWMGTADGLLVSYNPDKVFSPNFSIQRVKIPDVVSGLAVYLLEGEVVTSIAVDGGNRKWIGTLRSGLILQSADGTKQLRHFTAENSPLPSNNIQHIAINPASGEVFIATDKGLVSFRGDATEPSEAFGKVYAFPNPVRPSFSSDIIITGLIAKTNVKITDVSGNLVYETTSEGGQATWNGKNKQGNRVATGVYLFFCVDSTGEQTAVGKILFVN